MTLREFDIVFGPHALYVSERTYARALAAVERLVPLMVERWDLAMAMPGGVAAEMDKCAAEALAGGRR